jgi:hypothetical protein
MATMIISPNSYDTLKYSVFLAGSIDMGKARPWHDEVFSKLADLDVQLISPKRDDWDSSWEQDAHSEPFRSQVLWERAGMEAADMILYCFTKDSKAPISMYELGRYGNAKDCIVCVEEGFYRQGNLDIYCEMDGIPMYHNLDDLLTDLRTTLEQRA